MFLKDPTFYCYVSIQLEIVKDIFENEKLKFKDMKKGKRS